MHTGEIVDLANERRLSAALDFARGAANLLVLNGGSKAEEFAVLTTVRGRSVKTERAVYCIDSGTSMHICLPVPAGQTATDVTVEIVGDHGSMTLRQPASGRPRQATGLRILSMAAGIAALFVVAGGRLDAPTTLVASADPEPAPAEAPLVSSSRVKLTVPAHLPRVAVQPTHDVRLPVAPGVIRPSQKAAERRTFVALAPPPAQPRSDVPETPAPRMTDLHVPTTAKSGDFIPVRFGAVGRQVKIVASIGPTVVSKTIIAAQRGTIAIQSPKSDRLSRIMTVRAYAQDGKRSSILQAIVVLVHP